LESRSVYLGIATRLRGRDTGALSRAYLHSGISESLWYGVVESEKMFDARLMHAVMLASLYGNPSAKLDSGNDQVHEMYVDALEVLPYFRAVTRKASHGSTEELVEEWRRVNKEAAGGKGDAKEAGDGR